MPNTNEKVLLQVKISPALQDDLKALKDETGTSYSDMVKVGLNLLQWIIAKRKEGFDIYAVPPADKEAPAEKVQIFLPFI